MIPAAKLTLALQSPSDGWMTCDLAMQGQGLAVLRVAHTGWMERLLERLLTVDELAADGWATCSFSLGGMPQVPTLVSCADMDDSDLRCTPLEWLSRYPIDGVEWTEGQAQEQVRELLASLGLHYICAKWHDPIGDLPPVLRRVLSLVRAYDRSAGMLVLDDPSVGLRDHDVRVLSLFLFRLAEQAVVLWCTAQEHLPFGEHLPTYDLASPPVPAASLPSQEPCRSGATEAKQVTHCDAAELPTPGAGPAIAYGRRRGSGPLGFAWLVPGHLAGCPQPGLMDPPERDIERLWDAGVRVLVTLTESPLALRGPLRMEQIHFPVLDMHPPSDPEGAMALCAVIERHMAAGLPAAYHCYAGFGRTGTLLVMHLIGRGLPMPDALHVARSQKRQWVQSPSQVAFLESLPTGFLRVHRDARQSARGE